MSYRRLQLDNLSILSVMLFNAYLVAVFVL